MENLAVKFISIGFLLILFFTIFDLYYPSNIGYIGQLVSYLIAFVGTIFAVVAAFRKTKKEFMDKMDDN